MRRSLRLAVLAFGASLLTGAGAAEAQQKLVVYSSNDSTLNDLVFAAFRKETGIEVEPVSAGSGVLVKRLQAEKERPLGDIIWGVSRSLLESQQGAVRALRVEERGRRPGRVPRPRQICGSATTCICW